MAPPPPHAALLLLRLAALAPLLLLLAPACSAAPGVFQVRRRFPADGGGGGGIAALRSHDGCHHGRLLAAADLPLAGLSLPTDAEYAILHGDQAWDAAIGTGQLLDVVHWICQVVGLICGLLWGVVPLVGAVWIVLNLPWKEPTKGFSLDLGKLFGDGSDGLPLTIGLAAATGLGVLAYTEIETLLQFLGSAAIVQLVATKLLYAEDRQKTLKQIDEFFFKKVAPKDLVDEIKDLYELARNQRKEWQNNKEEGVVI